MKRWSYRWGLLSILLVFLFLCVACDPKPSEEFPQTHTTEEGFSKTPITSVTETPSPIIGTQSIDFDLPAAGSVMRWVDLSDFIFVPGGTFMMGADSELFTDFSPAHEVTLQGFWIQQAEVTNQQYAQCVADGICTPPEAKNNKTSQYGDIDHANSPVVNVSWYQAEEYCTYINGRLPSEAEWELTSRGTDSFSYPWGEDDPSCDLLNFKNCLEPSEPDDVRSYDLGASPFDAMDMAGNVFEWVADWYQEDYYQLSSVTNPTGPADGEEKIYRGGSYRSAVNMISPILRFSDKPEESSDEIGFRCVLKGSESDDSSVAYVPPSCQVIPYVDDQPITGPTMTPFPVCNPAAISSLCLWNGNQQQSVIKLSLADCYEDNSLYQSLWGNGELLDCTFTGTNPTIYTCNPPSGSAQGSSVEVKYCHKLPPNQPDHACLSGYLSDPSSGFCLPISDWIPDPPCTYGFSEYMGKCMPVEGEYDVFGCPVGFYSSEYEDITICLPVDECYWPDAPESCNQVVCPDGESYDDVNNCCMNSDGPKKICPIGWAYDTENKYCYVPDRWPDPCFTNMITLSYCSTPTPTVTPPPQRKCSDFSSQSSCEANGCTWEKSAGALDGKCVSK